MFRISQDTCACKIKRLPKKTYPNPWSKRDGYLGDPNLPHGINVQHGPMMPGFHNFKLCKRDALHITSRPFKRQEALQAATEDVIV
jgi:hypothetical protein